MKISRIIRISMTEKKIEIHGKVRVYFTWVLKWIVPYARIHVHKYDLPSKKNKNKIKTNKIHNRLLKYDTFYLSSWVLYRKMYFNFFSYNIHILDHSSGLSVFAKIKSPNKHMIYTCTCNTYMKKISCPPNSFFKSTNHQN